MAKGEKVSSVFEMKATGKRNIFFKTYILYINGKDTGAQFHYEPVDKGYSYDYNAVKDMAVYLKLLMKIKSKDLPSNIWIMIDQLENVFYKNYGLHKDMQFHTTGTNILWWISFDNDIFPEMPGGEHFLDEFKKTVAQKKFNKISDGGNKDFESLIPITNNNTIQGTFNVFSKLINQALYETEKRIRDKKGDHDSN